MRLVSLVLAVLLCSCGSNAPANGGGDDAAQPPGDSRSEDEGPQYACPPDHYELSVDGLFCHPCKTDGSGPQPVGEALDDGNDCTMDKCSVQSGVVHYNVPKACDDGDDSTVDDRCKSGHCVGTPTIACPKGNWFEKEPGQCYQCNGDGDGIEEGPYPIDDGNECTQDECDKGSGVENDPLDALCDDNDPATLADHCKDGVCVGLSEVTCTPEKWWKIGDGLCALCNATGDGVAQGPFVYEDDNVCTDDWCDEKDGVVHEPENGACDDGNPETIGDYCDGGECIPGNMVKCVAGKWFLKLGQCLLCNETGDGYVGEGLPVDDGNECTEDICDPDLGLLFKPDSGLCDDGDPGTTGDYCVDGKCQGFAATTCEPTLWFVLEGICFLCNIKGDGVEPLSAQVVDDGDPCTTDACGGQLPPKHTPVPEGTPCDDGNEFTEGDACTGGKCKGTVANKCPAGDWYLVDGLCYLCNGDGTGPSGEGLPIDDGNVCTDDECDAGSGVQHDNNSSPCDDGNPQTGADVCKKGSCIGKPKICVPNEWEYDGPYWCVKCNPDGTGHVSGSGQSVSDSESCTEDKCDPLLGVTHTNIEKACWDSSKCTLDDHCENGKCVGTPLMCDDGSPCTADSCDTELGCLYQVQAGPCDDANPLTPDDVCVAGICVGILDPDGDGVPNFGATAKCDGAGNPPGCVDNCPYRANADQKDSNHDGTGDACATPMWWAHFQTTQKVVAFTFDDGWDNDALEAILDAFDQYHGRATFFLCGDYIWGETLDVPTVKKLIARGHLLGNHTFDHVAGNTVEEAVTQILLDEDYFKDNGFGSLRPLYRIPSPDNLAQIMTVHQALQLTGFVESALAILHASDYDEPAVSALVKCIVDQVQPGDIIGLHVGPEATAQAIPEMLAALAAKGYSFLTLQEMLKYGKPEYIFDPSKPPSFKDCSAYF